MFKCVIQWLATLLKFFNNSTGGEVLDQDIIDLGSGINFASNLIFLSLNFINKIRVIFILHENQQWKRFENSVSEIIYLLEGYNIW